MSFPPLRALYYFKFDDSLGRRLIHQVPAGTLPESDILKVATHVLPKARNELHGHFIGLRIGDFKVMSCPMSNVKGDTYGRAVFQFNMCFVVDADTPDHLYQRVVVKFSTILESLERTYEFLSQPNKNECVNMTLESIMARVVNDLTKYGMCEIYNITPQHSVHFQINPFLHQPPAFRLDDCPLLKDCVWSQHVDDEDGDPEVLINDLCVRLIAPFCNGINSVTHIAQLAHADVSVVEGTVRNLLYYGLVVLFPFFQYSNFYRVTRQFSRFYEVRQDQRALEHMLDFVRLRLLFDRQDSDDATRSASTTSVPQLMMCNDIALTGNIASVDVVCDFDTVYKLLTSIDPAISLRDWTLRNAPRSKGVDERRLIQYACWKGYLEVVTEENFMDALREDEGEGFDEEEYRNTFGEATLKY